MLRVKQADPVHGKWSAPSEGECRVWCDAISIALGVCVEVDGVVLEDAIRLRKRDDGHHINVAELVS